MNAAPTNHCGGGYRQEEIEGDRFSAGWDIGMLVPQGDSFSS